MRVLAISDVEEGWLSDYYDPERLRGVDLVVSCGDASQEYLERVVTLANVPLLYVPGNHDAGYRERPPEGCVSIDGQIRDFRGLRVMGLGGSIRYNPSVYGFTEQEMRRRVAKMTLLAQATGGVDLVVTHAPVRGYGDLEDLPHRGFEAFGPLLERLRPRLLVHGHVHLQYGRIERTRVHPTGTLLVNACGSYVLDIPDDEIPDRTGGFRLPVEGV